MRGRSLLQGLLGTAGTIVSHDWTGGKSESKSAGYPRLRAVGINGLEQYLRTTPAGQPPLGSSFLHFPINPLLLRQAWMLAQLRLPGRLRRSQGGGEQAETVLHASLPGLP